MHGNRNANRRPHHLYVIKDRVDESVLKYGISSEPIDEDGLSKRVRIQLQILNIGAGWLRYTGKIIMENIPDRTTAKQIEEKYISHYSQQHGRRPRGNK